MSYRIIYLILQLLILLLPALYATITFEVNDYIKEPATEFLFYIFGVSGLIPLGLLSGLLELLIPEALASFVSLVIYVLVAIFVFLKFYRATVKHLALISFINLWLSLWSVLFGHIFMFLAMQ